jgi:putative ABC transport system substrate-binding protein
MRRREFIAGLGSAAAWPLAARAQGGATCIGFLHFASADAIGHRLCAFNRGLKESGFVEGDNVAITYRWAEGWAERLPELAADLVRQGVAIIVAPASADVASAARAAIRTIPFSLRFPGTPSILVTWRALPAGRQCNGS